VSITAPLRRRPVQQRSAQRVERMLDACAELIDEHGYDGVTTTLIAERAGVAVGSLYQFFPDKRAVVQALTLRNLERFLENLEARFRTARFTHWWDGFDAIIDLYMEMNREVPGFGRLHFGDAIDVRLLEPGRDNSAVIADRLAQLLTQHFKLPGGDLVLTLTVAIEASEAVLDLAFRRNPQGDPVLVNEAKHLVRGYLSSRIDSSRAEKR